MSTTSRELWTKHGVVDIETQPLNKFCVGVGVCVLWRELYGYGVCVCI